MPSFDALIIGGGTNGLACAHRLATGGMAVMVVEAADTPGGCALGWEFAPGFRSPGLAHLSTALDARVAAGMGLAAQGLNLGPALDTAILSPGADPLVLAGRFGATVQGLDPADHAAWPALRARLLRFADALAPFRLTTPPRLARNGGNDWMRLARMGLGLRGMGAAEFRELLRMLLINVWDVVEDDLADDRLKGCLAFDATLGAWAGPRSPNTLILLLNRLAAMGEGPHFPQGGMGAVAVAMARAASAKGVHLRTGARVARLRVEGDRAAGVVLEGGEELRAARVVSAIGPKETLLRLAPPGSIDTGLATAMRHQKARGGAAKLHLALSALPAFRADPMARMVIAPSADAVEEAFNPGKYGEVPARPVMEVVLPSAHGGGFAPGGQHMLSAIVQFAPHAPPDPDAARAAMLEASLAVLEDHAPGLQDLILHAEMLMPGDIQARHGLAGGNWHQGELSVEQMLFLRPLPPLAQYATPLPGLWLAGAGSHPGGGISGASGWNAAERILAEARA